MYKKIIYATLLSLLHEVGTGTPPWTPRYGVDTVPRRRSDDYEDNKNALTKDNIKQHLMVLLDGYSVGVTISAIATTFTESKTYNIHAQPSRAYFYNNLYRTGYKLPNWFSGQYNYPSTQKLWLRRKYDNYVQMPKWMRVFFPYVNQWDWEREEWMYNTFRNTSEHQFVDYTDKDMSI